MLTVPSHGFTQISLTEPQDTSINDSLDKSLQHYTAIFLDFRVLSHKGFYNMESHWATTPRLWLEPMTVEKHLNDFWEIWKEPGVLDWMYVDNF